MKKVKATDRKEYNKGSEHEVSIPDNTVLVEASFGVFGWNATLAKADGIRIYCHNGKPCRILRYGVVLWDSCRTWGKKHWDDYHAQKAWQEHVIAPDEVLEIYEIKAP